MTGPYTGHTFIRANSDLDALAAQAASGAAAYTAAAAALAAVATLNGIFIAGNGSPEGVQTALAGTSYRQNDATTEQATWIKRSASGAYGWELSSDVPRLVLPSPTPALTSYGDSFTAGQGASSASLSFIQLVASTLHATLVPKATGGVGVLYATNQVYKTELIPRTSGFMLHMAGFNDIRRGGSAAKTLAKITNCHRATMAAAFANTAVAADNVAVTKVGVWTPFVFQSMADHLGGNALSASAGATMSASFTGDSLVVGYITSDQVTYSFGPASVSVDGIAHGSFTCANGTDGLNDGVFDNTAGYGAFVLRGLGSGAHTVLITPSSGVPVCIDYIGTLAAPQSCAPLLLGTICRMNATGYSLSPANATDAIVIQASQLIVDVTQEFDGYPVRLVFPNTEYDLATGVNADNIHPNDTGHAQIASAFLKKVLGGGATLIDVSTAAVTGTSHLGKLSTATAASATSYGDTAQATATNTVAIGTNSAASGSSGIAVGAASISSAVRAIAIGTSTTASANDGTAVGSGASATTSTFATAIGSGAGATGGQSSAIGAAASATAAFSTALGSGASATHASATAVGISSATTATNQVMLGTAGETVKSLGDVEIGGAGKKLGFLGAGKIIRPTVTGSRGANAALASLLTELANLGLIVDSSS